LSNKTKRRLKVVMYHLLSLIFVGFLLLPIYQMIVTALKPTASAWSIPPTLYPHNITLDHFVNMWEIVPRLPLYLGNSFIYGIGVAVISLLIGVPSAYGLSRFSMKLKNPLLVALIYGNMFAPIMLLVPLKESLALVGLTDTYLGMILAGSIFTTPFSTWLLVSYFRNIPIDLEEAAFVDGANRWKVLTKVVLPLTVPALIAVGIYAFITGWSQQFLLALVLVQNDKLMPVTQGLYQFFSRSSVRWTELMAAALMTSFIPFLMFISVQRYLVKGMTSGAVKE
jgi:multiple sugar transport system permease protein